MHTIEGHLSAADARFGVIVSRFNHFITDRLLEGVMDALLRHGGSEDAVTVLRVPGAFEIPATAKRIAASGKFDAVICVGAVIRGSTPHFDFVAAEVTKGIAAASLDSGIPMSFGILTCDTIEQAIERAGTKAGNKGWEAALSAMEMVDLFRNITRLG